MKKNDLEILDKSLTLGDLTSEQRRSVSRLMELTIEETLIAMGREENVLFKIFKLITEIQDRIGNKASVSLYTIEGRLVFRVDWQEDNFHVVRQFTDIEEVNL